MMRRTRRTKPASAKAQPWSVADKECLQQTIDPLHNDFRKQPFGFLTSEGTTLLCARSTEIYDRLSSFLTTVGVVSGLVLSSIAGAALEPLDLDDYPPEKQMAAETFNTLGAIAVAAQLFVVLYSTFTLYILTASCHNPTAAYRATLHMKKWIGFLEFMTFVPAVATAALIVLAVHLRCSSLATWIVGCTTCTLCVAFQGGFNLMCNSCFPYNAWAWSTMASGGAVWLSSRVEADARNHGELLISQAKEAGVLNGIDEDGDYVIDSAEQLSQRGSELEEWLKTALEHDFSPTRLGVLAHQLLSVGLTRARMYESVQHPGGYQTLCEMLSFDSLGLNPGDRLALASAIMRDVPPLDKVSVVG